MKKNGQGENRINNKLSKNVSEEDRYAGVGKKSQKLKGKGIKEMRIGKRKSIYWKSFEEKLRGLGSWNEWGMQ